MALETVQDYVDRARVILLDEALPYRYSQASLVQTLNQAIGEGRRLKPELFLSYLRGTLPAYSENALTATVDIDPMFRATFVYYMVGQAQIRDEENTQDQRAAAMLNKFTSQLLTIVS